MKSKNNYFTSEHGDFCFQLLPTECNVLVVVEERLDQVNSVLKISRCIYRSKFRT